MDTTTIPYLYLFLIIALLTSCSPEPRSHEDTKGLFLGVSTSAQEYVQMADSCYRTGSENLGIVERCDLSMTFYLKSLETIRNEASNDSIHRRYMFEVHDKMQKVIQSYIWMAEYEKALRHIELVLEDRLLLLGPNHIKIAHSYYFIGWCCQYQGRKTRALDCYNKALKIRLEAHGENHLGVAEIYNKLGNFYNDQGDYYKALTFFRKTLNIKLLIHGENHVDVAASYNNIAIIYEAINELDKALEYNHKSIKIRMDSLSDMHPSIAENYDIYGSVYLKKDELEMAIESYQKALRVNRNYPYRVAANSNSLAKIYIQQGETPKAINLLDKALEINLDVFGPKHINTALTYYLLGTAYEEDKDVDMALSFYQKALLSGTTGFSDSSAHQNPTLRALSVSPVLLNVLAAKASALYEHHNHSGSMNDLTSSFRTLQLCDSLTYKMRNGYHNKNAKLNLGESAKKIYEKIIQVTLKLYQLTKKEAFREMAFEYAEKSKGVVMLQMIREMQAKNFSGIPNAILEEENQLIENIEYYEVQRHKALSTKSVEDSLRVVAYEDKLFRDRRKYENLVKRLEHDYPEYYHLKYRSSTSSIEQIQSALDPNTVLLEYFVGESNLYAFIITPDTYELKVTSSSALFNKIVYNYCRSIRTADVAKYIDHSAKLYDILIRPIESTITNKSRLIIIPDDQLFYVPFEALTEEKPASSPVNFSTLDYLVNRYQISYHYSSTLFTTTKNKVIRARESGNIHSFLGFAPSFSMLDDDCPTGSTHSYDISRLKPLVYAEKEVSDIKKALNRENFRTRSLIADEASEVNFKGMASGYEVIQLATHSFLNEEHPQFSGIVLSQSERCNPNAQEDGILYAAEIFRLKMAETDLVVLSSCESGLGKLVRGEGLLALPRSFIYAGVPNIMYSLWKVYDKPTHSLMVDFYTNMGSGRGYAEALQMAKIRMIQNPKTAFPKNWSSFVLIGS